MSYDPANPLGREYTPAEWAAARRTGLTGPEFSSKKQGGLLTGALGSYWPDHARRMANDWALVADAMEREWKKDIKK